ncbi:hypothetical protein [Cerasicoccus maritimus]|uniref:hypothetical protein n=1 Tax=Cerasicoccus maritimus TaxID=490089 RepID=UPI0028528F94|nr:hypothetical protein [Cerasicoccus maritimus]
MIFGAIRQIFIGSAFLALPSFGAAQTTESTATEDISLIEVPQATQEELLDKQKNLARWHMGATLYDASEDFLNPITWQEADSTETIGVLMLDDPTGAFHVKPGEYRFVVDLNDFFTVTRFNFKNFTAKGSVQLFYSRSLEAPDASAWKSAAEPDAFTRNQVVSPKFLPFEARYIMAHLIIEEEGLIGNMGAFGDLSVAEVRMNEQKRDENIAANTNRSTDSKPVKYNYASAHSDSRVSYVSSGDASQAIAMIDDDVESSYEFSPDDKENIVIVDLGDQREVNSVSMLFESGPGTFDFYVVNKLPDDIQQMLDEQTEQNNAKREALKAKPDKGENDDMAMIFNHGQWEPLLLAQNNVGDALGSVVGFAGDTIFSTIALPGEFFSSLSPTVEQTVNGSDERFRINFSNLTGRYLIIRFVPTPGSGTNMKVYEVSLMGDIIVQDDEPPVDRIEAFSMFNPGSGSLELAPPPQQILAPPIPAPPPPVSP